MPIAKIDYHSGALRRKSYAWVITPQSEEPFPVLYLLHGLPDRPRDWLRRSAIAHLAHPLPLCIVLPEGGGFYCNEWERCLSEELPKTIEERFPAIPKRECRGIAGISIGGYGAMKLALKCPDIFCSVSGHSGAYGWGHRRFEGEVSWRELLEGRNIKGGVRALDGGILYRLALRAPFRNRLSLYKSCMTMRRPENDLYAIIDSFTNSLPPVISIDCGSEDFLLQDSREFHTFLEEKSIPHGYAEYPGAHNWRYWNNRLSEMLDFHARSMHLIK